MSENAASPKRGLFQSLSKRVSEYRNKKKDDPSSPRSQASETTSESQRSMDDVDLLEVQATPFAQTGRAAFDDLEICFSGKSARMSRGGMRRPDMHTIAAH
ncbi:hypothetical protein WJX79_003940 [Trebouxia sp. C0005]